VTRSEQTSLRALARVPRIAITGVVTAGPDANGSVTITGQTYRRARVSLDLQADGTIEQTTRADAAGRYQFTFTVGFGGTPVRVSATAHGHRATSLTLTVNRAQTPGNPSPGTPKTTGNPSPGNPQPAANLPVGVWDYYYSQIVGREVTNGVEVAINADGTGGFEYALLTKAAPFDPSSQDLVHWDIRGNWSAQGSQLRFVGSGTITETSAENPSTDRSYSVNVDFTFSYFGKVNQGTVLDLTLDSQIGPIQSPGGPTLNIALNKTG
jgi:hypothetical protein